MTDDLTVDIQGLAELQQTLEELPYKTAKKGLRRSLKAGAAPIQSGMVAEAPKHTGFLAEHFGAKVKLGRDGLSGSAFIGPQGKVDYPMYLSGAYNIIRNKAGKVVAKVGKIAVATIARFLEFGTRKMPKNAFMTRAWESQKAAALAAITVSLADAVAEAAEESRK